MTSSSPTGRSYVIGAVEFSLTLAALIWGWMEYLSLEGQHTLLSLSLSLSSSYSLSLSFSYSLSLPLSLLTLSTLSLPPVDNVSCGTYFEDEYQQLFLFFFSTIIIQSLFFSFIAVPALLWFAFRLYILLYALYYGVEIRDDKSSADSLLNRNSGGGEYDTFY
jgi:hypothetical protein